MELSFRSSSFLINEILEDLDSYQSSGYLDEGLLYGWVKDELELLNIPSQTSVKIITKLNGNVLEKPEGYKYLWSIWKVDPCSHKTERKQHLQKHDVAIVRKQRCNEAYMTECEHIIFEGDYIETKYYIEEGGHEVTDYFCNRQPLKIFNAPNVECNYDPKFKHCHSPYQVREEKDRFTFNFEDEYVYFEYYSLLLDEDGLPLIPNESVLEESIRNFVVYKFFRKAYQNSWFDAYQLKQDAERDYIVSHDKAVKWLKTPSFKQTLKNSERLRDRFSILDKRKIIDYDRIW